MGCWDFVKLGLEPPIPDVWESALTLSHLRAQEMVCGRKLDLNSNFWVNCSFKLWTYILK